MLVGMKCPFCDPARSIVCSNASAIAIRDAYPVSEGHTLVIPLKHEPNLTRLDSVSYRECFDLVRNVIDGLIKEFDPAGFNVGVNTGESAGQSVDHAHIHVIPRYENDTPNPRGGVRGVIPGKADY
jgi:diadenosine tetraphosphate (Ap4A) HIT family hydrolase